MTRTNQVRALSFALIASTTLLCTPAKESWAMLAPAHNPATMEGRADTRAADMKSVQNILESKIVRERLKLLGLTDKEIETRLSRLSDKQVHQLAKDIETISPGGSVAGILVVVILVLLIVYLFKRL